MNTIGSERVSFVQLTPTIRRRLEATVENLIAMLDALDGDPDAEPGLGAPELRAEQSQAFWPRGAGDEGELTSCETDPDFGSRFPELPMLGALPVDEDEDDGDCEPCEVAAS